MATILITGGTGLVGTAIAEKLLEMGHAVIILSRDPEKRSKKFVLSGLTFARWDIAKQEIDRNALMNAEHIIHLAGAGIADKRWTEKRKKEIVDSRVQSSLLLARSLVGLKHKVKSVVSASAIGWYGPGKADHLFIESDPPANDFLGITCSLWEKSVDEIARTGIRLVKLRTGIVLSRRAGALPEFVKPMKFGIAPIMGNGKQIMNWIHIKDLSNLYIFSLFNENLEGSFNAVTAQPITNKEFVKAIAKARKRFYIPVRIPRLALRLGLGEMSEELLKSCPVSNRKMQDEDFDYEFPEIKIAAADLFKRKNN